MSCSSGRTEKRPAKRVRTDAQLAQKRRMDRLKHKENRAESKARLENIEQDVALLRNSITGIVDQLQGLQDTLIIHHASTRLPPTQLELPTPDDPHNLFLSNWLRSSYLQHWQQPSSNALPLSPSLPPIVECRCGVVHSDRSECLEMQSFMMLYQTHVALAQNPQAPPRIPRNPSLAHIMLQSVSDNPLVMVISSAMKQFQAQNVETVFGLYFLAYRLLRWRMYPSTESFNDVPQFIRPTEAQTTIPHPVTIDYLPWPKLRKYLCENQHQDVRHSVTLYMSSIRLIWPADKQLLCVMSNGKIELNPHFEEILKQYLE